MVAIDVTNRPEPVATECAASTSEAGQSTPRKPRVCDGGPDILPDMGRFVTLVRQVSHRPLITQWLQHAQRLPEVDWDNSVGALYKRSLFAAVATLPGLTRKHLEDAADRILLLADDYGCQVVKSLLLDADEIDGKTVETALDKHGRALYLYLCRLSNAADRRFEQAEMAREQARQWKSETYASHFRGPAGVVIALDEALKEKLKGAIARLYPQAPLEDVVIEHFQRRDLAQAGSGDAEENEPTAPGCTLERVIQPFRAGRCVVGNQQQHRCFEPFHVVSPGTREPHLGKLIAKCLGRDAVARPVLCRAPAPHPPHSLHPRSNTPCLIEMHDRLYCRPPSG
ncbi:hypothetical protein [Neopusillimonas aromaticivorans]|uniref:hypothetical protein n=1 Tax=Neopusillimonas aromaticivorans TaxID=2979868 RepID=UPI002594B30E|nr:hypothetical protein [Neopusillimonas aromaticivorans]WJJ93114.1 hypothetical protein N7E01_13670 [Neopusillimonas aromaticivorans]